MATVTFDALKFVETLESTGIDRKHAEAFAKAVRNSQEDALIDFAKTAQEASARAVNEVDSKTEKALIKLEAKVDKLEQRLDMRIDSIRKDIIIWLGGLLIAGFVALAGLLIKLLP